LLARHFSFLCLNQKHGEMNNDVMNLTFVFLLDYSISCVL
jgi:hypothetical protein